jgi:hypothetical protein
MGSSGPLYSLGKQAFWCYPQSSRLQLSSLQWGTWHSHSLMGDVGALQLSGTVGMLSLCALLVPLTE